MNGRVRGRLSAPVSSSDDDLSKAALADIKIQRYIEGSAVRKIIVVPGKLINIVISQEDRK